MTHLNFTLSPCGHQRTLEITCLPHTRVKYYIKPREGAEPQAREGNIGNTENVVAGHLISSNAVR